MRYASMLGVAMCSVLGAELAAQAAPPPAGAGTIVGIVVDTTGRPLDGVSVLIEARRRQVVTGADGQFRFSDVGSDSVTVATRRIGFYPQAKRVKAGKDGATLVLELVPRIAALPASVVEASVSGLSGVVSDTGSNGLAGAFVQVLGSGAGNARTDSSGSFFVNARPGHYLVRITKDGHQGQMVSVTIPEKGGRRLAVRLTPGLDPYHARETWAADGLRDRLARRSAAWSRVFTREDIAKMNALDVVSLARLGAVGRVDDDCMATIGATRTSVPLWAIDPGEIEFMEVYARYPTGPFATINPRGVTSLGGSAPIRTQQRSARPASPGSSGPCPAGLIIWTQK